MAYSEYASFNEADRKGFKNAAGLLDAWIKKTKGDLPPASREKLRAESMADFRHICAGIQIKFLNAPSDQKTVAIGDVTVETGDCTRLMHTNEVMFRPDVLPAVLALKALKQQGKLPAERGASAVTSTSHAFAAQFKPNAFHARNREAPDYNGYRPFNDVTKPLGGYALRSVQRAFSARHAKDKTLEVSGVNIPVGALLFMSGADNHPQLCYKPEIESLIEEIGSKVVHEKNIAKKSPASYIGGDDGTSFQSR